ncbi:hypothetical protein BU14_0415s0007 [Porphyra umbilicalis]|uniref:Glycoside hydrolase family 31 N-terminal domain-containing protein n=1 Tax=Porphyra umbilicalis TaxID=2786 RepID=A0A1X6NWB2_PORUM|nr:hypothetical protein BU14_0415s0007 [Porphyra umbilicalis]|eukprot:OSX72663.1 hypothetical protein BU14_0415s0007 [Porphyra umbilicalis]
MYQHWPLDKANWELGPFYPFDNGPAGLCTLADPSFVSSSGLALTVDEVATPCLHVGLNASVAAAVADRPPLAWGVGVANFDRKLLPAVDAGEGDGRLTLQSRGGGYDYPHVAHPLQGWRPAASAAVAADAGAPVGSANGGGVGGDGAPAVSDAAGTSVEAPRLRPRVVLRVSAADGLPGAARSLLRAFPVRGAAAAPPPELLANPIWTTWARYKDGVTQADVLAFAAEIVSRGLPRSVMEIDDRWSVAYGDMAFDPVKFPDPARMVDKLHMLGFRVTLWVLPFASATAAAVEADVATRAPADAYYFRARNGGEDGNDNSSVGRRVASFDWWQPTPAAALDLTNPAASADLLARLQLLAATTGVDGFKFDGGEACFLPPHPAFHNPAATATDYTRAYVQQVASAFPLSEVRAGVPGCQSAPPLTRLFDRFSSWGPANGLASVIPAALTAGLLGYPFVLPDMVGGNDYGEGPPSAELLTRWAQASVAMPAVQLSIAPWSYGEAVGDAVAAALGWRTHYFGAVVAAAAPAAAEAAVPIMRPVWWGADADAGADVDGGEPTPPLEDDVLCIADAFLLGPNVLVAPVVRQGARARDVWLPPGLWRRVDVRRLADGLPVTPWVGEELLGGLWLRQVPAALDDMPVYERVG